jgi:DNA-directed RNA polymerase subunit K/omega
MPKKKQNKKVKSDPEEPYNSEDDYALKSEEEDVESEESEGETSSENSNETESAEETTEKSAEATDEEYNPETNEEKTSTEEQSSDVEEDIDDIETEADAGTEIGEEVGEIDETGEGNEFYVGESKVCYMKNLDKDFVVLDEDDSNMYAKMEYKKIPQEERISDPILTYYELVRIIGTRAQQFNFGAVPLVKNLGQMHPAKMAYVELRLKLTPYIIRRHLPGKKYEEWNVDELEQIHILTDDFFVPDNVDWDKQMIQADELNKKAGAIKKI